MCFQCHSGLSTQKVVDDYQNFKNEIDNCKSFYELSKIFEILNSTSISHMILAALYVNGNEARELAMCCLRKFIDWYKVRGNSKLYWIKRQIRGLFLSKEEQRLNKIFEYNPNISRLETIYANLLEFNRKTFMDGKYAELSDDEYKNKFFGHIEQKEDSNKINEANDGDGDVDEADESDKSDESDKGFIDENKDINSLEMANTIYQFIYKGVNIDNNKQKLNYNSDNNHYLFNQNHLFIFSVVIGTIIGSIIGGTIGLYIDNESLNQ